MKLQHVLGGLERLGPVSVETRPFVEEWEKRIFGIHVAMMALSTSLKDAEPPYDLSDVPTAFKHEWTWGHLRTGAEGMNPFDYFKFRYFEKWLGGISSFFVDNGYITAGELQSRTEARLVSKPSTAPARDARAIDEQVLRYLQRGDSPQRKRRRPAKFAVGDGVVIKDVHPVDHTRLPGYLRNKKGRIFYVYEEAYTYFFSTGPDGIGTPMPVYIVKFEPRDIWGEMSEPNSFVFADLFEAYLLPIS